jgi:hypothetical protein
MGSGHGCLPSGSFPILLRLTPMMDLCSVTSEIVGCKTTAKQQNDDSFSTSNSMTSGVKHTSCIPLEESHSINHLLQIRTEIPQQAPFPSPGQDNSGKTKSNTVLRGSTALIPNPLAMLSLKAGLVLHTQWMDCLRKGEIMLNTGIKSWGVWFTVVPCFLYSYSPGCHSQLVSFFAPW